MTERERGDAVGPRPPVIEDGLLHPMFILVTAMVVAPAAAGALFDWAAAAFSSAWTPVDEATLRTGVSLIVQGGTMIGLTVRRVAGRTGLGLPPAALGLARPGPGRSWRREIAVGVAAGIGLTALNVIGSWASQRLFGLFMEPEVLAEHVARESTAVAEALGAGATGWLALLLPFIAVVVAPLSEEIFFRGYLYAVFASRFRRDPWYAVYGSGAIFALVHFYIIHFIPVFLIGMALAYLYRLRGSLIAPVIAHATANFIVTAAAIASLSQ